jgi:excinuclease ABC subunit A
MHPIRLRGARTHHLKGIDVDLVPGELTVVAGVSGAGKSSLAFDTLYAEGQRRFVESFSPYARQFLERLERPPVDLLEPVAAGIAVDRRAPIKSSRSTVATMADLEAYLSALFTSEALPVCPDCGELARALDADTAAREAVRAHPAARALVSYPLAAESAEVYLEVREELARQGFRRLVVRGEVRDLDDVKPSEALAGAGVVVDRLALAAGAERRLAAAIEQAWRASPLARIHLPDGEVSLRGGLSCPRCARTFRPAQAGLFSYQSPVGACPGCRGFGRVLGIDWAKVIPDASLSLGADCIRPWRGKKATWERRVLREFCAAEGIDLEVPWRSLTDAQREMVLAGSGRRRRREYPGVRAWFRWLEGRSYKMHVRVMLARYRSYDPCGACGGKRLSERSLGYRVDGLDLGEWHRLELAEARVRLERLPLAPGHGAMARDELVARLGYLEKVGLGYLTLDRQARTLSGGEAQRVSLTAALGSSLTGALFVLDEPTVGLHPSDVPPLVTAMRDLARRGNAVVCVEHDRAVVSAADRVLELGPEAGKAGGALVFDGTPAAAARQARATRQTLAPIALGDGGTRRPKGELVIRGARANNLRGDDIRIPLGAVTCVCGPSGSGKSSLVEDVLYRALARATGEGDVEPAGAHDAIEGAEAIRGVVLADQAPLGRTSRGNAATYTGAWTCIRELFAASPEAQLAGLTAASFSFNVAGGRCEACSGEGAETVEMQFLADVRLQCPVCQGKRFRPEVLDVRLDGRTIADVLALSAREAFNAFEIEGRVFRALRPVLSLGLGYLPLGQPLSTLSGGESQRLKLARALKQAGTGVVLICDEPSAGLHAGEIERLMKALGSFADAGATVVVVDHDPAVIAGADHCIELGPGAGAAGGRVVASGPPARLGDTLTGKALAAAAREHVFQATPAREEAAPRSIAVRGAREHNLAGVDVDIPHGALTVVTGPSGSGKSSLAFDVVFAEGQRRFLETLTPYARQFLPIMARPDVDRIVGLPPSVALEQRTARAGAGSTVATVTEIAHYLRLLFAKLGEPWCPDCEIPVAARSPEAIFADLVRLRGAITLRAPVVKARKGTHYDVFTAAERSGIAFAVCDGEVVATEKPPRLAARKEHTVELIVHTGRAKSLPRPALMRALALGKGQIVVARGADPRAPGEMRT